MEIEIMDDENTLASKRNTVETRFVPAREETLVNSKYILDSEDENYYYCYYNSTYRVKILKDEARKDLTYRDSKGRMLAGFSLNSGRIKQVSNKPVKKRKRFTQKKAESYLQNDLLPALVEKLENDDLTTAEKLKAMLALYNYVKPTLSKTEDKTTIKIVNDEFAEGDE